MNQLYAREENCYTYYCKHDGIIYDVFLGGWVVKSAKQLHKILLLKGRFKTVLPNLAMEKKIREITVCLKRNSVIQYGRIVENRKLLKFGSFK